MNNSAKYSLLCVGVVIGLGVVNLPPVFDQYLFAQSLPVVQSTPYVINATDGSSRRNFDAADGSSKPNFDAADGGINRPTGPIKTIDNPLKFKNIEDLIFGLVNLALKLGVIVAVIAIIWIGFQFIKAQGNDKEIAEARTHFMWTVIGIAILFGAQIIVQIIRNTIEPFLNP